MVVGRRNTNIMTIMGWDIQKLLSFSNFFLIAVSNALYEVGTAALVSRSAWFFACADSISPPILAPWFRQHRAKFELLTICDNQGDNHNWKGKKKRKIQGNPAVPHCKTKLLLTWTVHKQKLTAWLKYFWLLRVVHNFHWPKKPQVC